jgi:hypothetical protein
MQVPTHILTGILIQRSAGAIFKPRGVELGVTAALAFLSHGFLDELERVTYHPGNPDFHNPAWVIYYSVVAVASMMLLIWWWKPFKWGIVFAALPDLDWVFIYGPKFFHFPLPFYRQPHLHNLLHYIYHQIPPFTGLTAMINRLPNERNNPWAGLWEVLLVAGLWLLARRSGTTQNAAPRKSAPRK